jgi:hypothetical protein
MNSFAAATAALGSAVITAGRGQVVVDLETGSCASAGRLIAVPERACFCGDSDGVFTASVFRPRGSHCSIQGPG